MRIPFHKYHGTGNDFVLIDNREGLLRGDEHGWFAAICHRHFGIGADGVILLLRHDHLDFEMDYFNADGQRSTMCGNGGRCMARFAADLGMADGVVRFQAIDGLHEAALLGQEVKLKMTLPHDYRALDHGDYYIHTGSPHYVRWMDAPLGDLDVVGEGRRIRRAWSAEGVNVNFAHLRPDGSVAVRTYERGVEDETLSCGTGVTAVAEVLARIHGHRGEVVLHTPGGVLRVHLHAGAEPWLQGPATHVFTGSIDGPH